ncbi:MAG: HEAT repeat domain-containing protein, partial [Acidobacteria bacterium]|nr:HEAT repeat domain-containing protein [Acidobacteriota bacterium]
MPVESVVDAIATCLQRFTQNATAGRMGLVATFEADSEHFLENCLPLLKNGFAERPGNQLLVAFLMAKDLLVKPLAEPGMLTVEEAAEVLKVAKVADPAFDVTLLHKVTEMHSLTAYLRVLEVLMLGAPTSRLAAMLAQVMRDGDLYLKSKAALLLGRLHQKAGWVERQLSHADVRVRANAVESLWGDRSADAQKVFTQALSDEHQRTVGNALVGLYRAGDPRSIRQIISMAQDDRTPFKVTALWAMGHLGDPRFLPWLTEAMGRMEATLRPSVFQTIRRIRQQRDLFSSYGTLNIHMAAANQLPDGTRRVRFSVVEAKRPAVLSEDSLVATSVGVYEDGESELDYTMKALSVPELLSIAIALPFRSADDPVQRGIAAAAPACVPLKRPCDQWAVLRYSNNGPAEGDKTLKVPVGQLTGNLDEATALFMETGTNAQAAANLDKAATQLIKVLASAPGARHLILVADSAETLAQINVSAQKQAAEIAKVRIHTITPELSASEAGAVLDFEKLARDTGGLARRMADPELLTLPLQATLSNGLSQFELTYRKDDSGGGFPELKMQVY